MEVQLTIFDVYKDLDAESKKELSIYDRCSVPGVHFEDCCLDKLRGYTEKIVVDNQTGKTLFGIKIVERFHEQLSFSYTALDKYWGGNYQTNDIEDIRSSILNLSNDIRREEEL